MQQIIFTTLFVLATCFVTFAQSEVNETLLTKQLQLADKNFHKLEIKSDGVYLDGKNKGNLKRLNEESGFGSTFFFSETADYWGISEDSGYWILVGTSMATGMCGIPTYAMIYVDGRGNVRVSKESPPACIGDFPIKIEFDLNFDKQCDRHPIWKISNSLEFDGCTFSWKDLQIKTKTKTRKN